jgi:hypothetical protein
VITGPAGNRAWDETDMLTARRLRSVVALGALDLLAGGLRRRKAIVGVVMLSSSQFHGRPT